jgi:hypothetical protein
MVRWSGVGKGRGQVGAGAGERAGAGGDACVCAREGGRAVRQLSIPATAGVQYLE